MRFICDVHISYKLVHFLISAGYEALHVNNLPDKWYTSDHFICDYADINDFIVITKDTDFRNSFFLKKTPRKLIKINLGNISNSELISILSRILKDVEKVDTLPAFLIEIDINDYNLITL